MSLFRDYECHNEGYDELFSKVNIPRQEIHDIFTYFNQIDKKTFLKNHQIAKEIHRNNGVSFNYRSENGFNNNIFPFDLIPRIILKNEWDHLEKGLLQRVRALNLFLNDVYNAQHILKHQPMLKELILSSSGFLREVQNFKPIDDLYIHIAGIDLIRDNTGNFVVLEDNLRIPSGISYVLENRNISKKVFPEVFTHNSILPVEDYPKNLAYNLSHLNDYEGIQVVLSPGPFNSAYFEHQYLAKALGFMLVEGNDLCVINKKVYLKKDTRKRVGVIYKRISDDYLDPNQFLQDSLIGVEGLFESYQSHQVAITNALGNGVADDKAIFPYVPEFIRYYLNEDPILKQIPTYSCLNEGELKFVLENIHDLVVKNTNMSGGQEVYIGKNLDLQNKNTLIHNVKQNKRHYIAQPLINFSFSPTLIEDKFEPRRFDFRPYILLGKKDYVLPGGLTRVALKRDGYIVNSCQGGGSKDTWIFSDTPK